MFRKNKKCGLLAAAIAAMLLMLIFAGCTPQETASAATPSPTPENSAVQKENAIKAGDVYRYYLWSVTDEKDPLKNAGPRADSMRKRLAEFEQKYDITVKYVASTGGYEWYDLPRSSAAAGEPICDIFNVGGPYVVLGTYFYGGQAGKCILPLSDYSSVADFSDTEYWNVESQRFCTFSGKLYCAVPLECGGDAVSSNTVTLFNKDLMAKAGYEADKLYEMSRNGEWTWERFEEAAVRTTDIDNGIYGTTIGDNVALGSALIVTNGGAYFKNNGTTDVFVGNSDNAIAAWDFIVGLAKKNCIDYSGTTEANLFGTGKVAMMVTTISRLVSVYKFLKCDYGIINPPKGPMASDYLSEMSWFTPISVMRGANNPAGCVQVINEYLSPEYARSSAENQELMDAELTVYLKDAGSVETAKNITKYTSNQNYYLYQQVSDGDTKMLSYLYGNVWNFISGETTPKQFYDSVTDKINSMVASVR